MRTRYFLLCLLLPLLGVGCNEPITTSTKLVVYTYESLNADYGLLPQILPEFEFNNNIQVDVVTFPDAGVMLNQLIAEQANPKADVVIGLDNLQEPAIEEHQLVQKLVPFDYGYVAFIYDTQTASFPNPISLIDLSKPEYKDKIIIEQPGLSSPGSQLLVWSHTALDDQAQTFWEGMKENVLTVAPDWNTAYYSLFLNEQAPIVLSYITSPAFHEIEESSERYKVLPIKEGYLKQIEYAGIINGTTQAQSAQRLIDYVLSPAVQQRISTTQWMYPIAKESVQLPAAFTAVEPTSDQIYTIDSLTVHDQLPNWLMQWNSIFGK